MITTLGIALIVILVAVEIGCFVMLRKILREISAERTDKRRAKYRNIAYADMEERWQIKQNREQIWAVLRIFTTDTYADRQEGNR